MCREETADGEHGPSTAGGASSARGKRVAIGHPDDCEKARTAPLVRCGHPSRFDRQQRLQELHLRPALPETALGPVRGGSGEADRGGACPKTWHGPSPDEHQFFVPTRARWHTIQKQATNIGETLNIACAALEDENNTLEGVLAGIDYNDAQRLGDARNRDNVLGRLVQHFSQVSLRNDGMAEPDMLGRAYEYLIEQFADDAGKKGGEFYTPRMVVRLIVELLQPTEGMRICDPTAGSGGMLIECAHHIERQGGNPGKPHTAWAGEEPQHVGHLQDEHAAPRASRRADREGGHDSGPEAGG